FAERLVAELVDQLIVGAPMRFRVLHATQGADTLHDDQGRKIAIETDVETGVAVAIAVRQNIDRRLSDEIARDVLRVVVEKLAAEQLVEDARIAASHLPAVVEVYLETVGHRLLECDLVERVALVLLWVGVELVPQVADTVGGRHHP